MTDDTPSDLLAIDVKEALSKFGEINRASDQMTTTGFYGSK